ncbi:MAG: hypothetical protein RL398_1866 [Planctomycetota bacterium]
MNAFGYLALIAFVPLCCWVFRRLDTVVAIVAATVAGFLFLPVPKIEMVGLPDLNKFHIVGIGVICGVFAKGEAFRWRFRPNVCDALFIANVFAMPMAYLANGFPPYSAMSDAIGAVLFWVPAYLVGRQYLADRRGMTILLWGYVLGALAYLPLCLWEVRMSPQLHTQLYGVFQHSFLQMVREGGYRPIVFTRHGLEVALWMATATIAAVVLWLRGGVTKLRGVPMMWVVGAVVLGLLLCRSLGSILLASIMVPAMLLRRGPLLVAVYVTIGITYLSLRLFAAPQVYDVISSLAQLAPPDRSQSMMFRVDMEEVMMKQAWLQPWFGWTIEQKGVQLDPWGDPEGVQGLITDSLWIIAFLGSGLVGVVSLYGTFVGACLRLWTKFRFDGAANPERMALMAIVATQMIDTLPNASVAPTSILAIGALVGSTVEEAVPDPSCSEPVAESAAGELLLRPRRRPFVDA